MGKKYYFDTSIWRDYFENRKDNFRPLGEWAFELIKKMVENNDALLYSDVVITELRAYFSEEEVSRIFAIARSENILVKVYPSEKQESEASRLCKMRKIPFNDVLQAILARDNQAVLVTRDKHFLQLNDLADSKKPEELI